MTFTESGNKQKRDVKILDYFPKTNIFQVEDINNSDNEYVATPSQLKINEAKEDR
jgi:hypothetical protein